MYEFVDYLRILPPNLPLPAPLHLALRLAGTCTRLAASRIPPCWNLHPPCRVLHPALLDHAPHFAARTPAVQSADSAVAD